MVLIIINVRQSVHQIVPPATSSQLLVNFVSILRISVLNNVHHIIIYRNLNTHCSI